MDYSHRTVIRHVAVAAALLSLPFFLGPPGPAWIWFKDHALYFVLVGCYAIGFGLLADWLVQKLILPRFLLLVMQANPPGLSALQKNRALLQEFARQLGYTQRLIFLWGSCSRCVAYWTTGFFTCFTFLVVWPYFDLSWSSLLVLLYFSMLAASLSAGMVVIFYLFRLRQK